MIEFLRSKKIKNLVFILTFLTAIVLVNQNCGKTNFQSKSLRLDPLGDAFYRGATETLNPDGDPHPPIVSDIIYVLCTSMVQCGYTQSHEDCRAFMQEDLNFINGLSTVKFDSLNSYIESLKNGSALVDSENAEFCLATFNINEDPNACEVLNQRLALIDSADGFSCPSDNYKLLGLIPKCTKIIADSF